MNEKIEMKSWYFFRFQELIMHDTSLDAFDKSTYAALSMHADTNTGMCFPSLKTLAEKAGCSKPRLIKSIKNLVKKGYIEKKKRKNDIKGNISNVYKVVDLSYINNALNNAKENNNERLEKALKLRLNLENSAIPDYNEVLTLVNEINKGGKRDLQGLVNEINKACKRDLHELEPNNKNHINNDDDDSRKSKKEIFDKKTNKLFKEVFEYSIKEYQKEELRKYKFSPKIIQYAIKKTGKFGGKTFAYLLEILDSYIENDIQNIEDIKKLNKRKRNNNNLDQKELEKKGWN